MDELLFLAHRIPYPPDKGDKIRSWHFLKHLAGRYRVHLGCFIDDPRDWEFTDFLRQICGDCHFVPLNARAGRLRSLAALVDGRPMTLPYYFDRSLDKWVGQVLSRPAVSRVFVYCSAMAQYVPQSVRHTRHCVADLVDVDSEKWNDYARNSSKPATWLWQRESRRLRAIENGICESFAATLVATPSELELLRQFASPGGRMVCVPNGVDADYFSPDRHYDRPTGMPETAIVFTGAMDYRPNIDAVLFFVHSVLPLLKPQVRDINFYIVGSNPRPEVLALTSREGVVVTGRVADVRPYLAHARAVVAPLRIARGIQNKVLEGMAMARPVIASPEALLGIHIARDAEALVAADAAAFAAAVARVLTTGVGDSIGRSARRRVLADYQWAASLEKLEDLLGARDRNLAA